MGKPVFIVFEGGEGSGKSTQAKALTHRLRKVGVPVLLTHEPGGTPIGDRLRRWLKFGRGVTTPSELLCFEAARSQLVTQVIRPALARGQAVVCDRFTASTVAYQGYGRGIDLGLIESLNEFVTDDLKPDLTVLLDIGAEQGLGRKRSRGDCFEGEEFGFHLRVRDGYLKLAAADPEKWLVVDAMLPVGQVEGMVWGRVQLLLV
jgi:dTMP kinase